MTTLGCPASTAALLAVAAVPLLRHTAIKQTREQRLPQTATGRVSQPNLHRTPGGCHAADRLAALGCLPPSRPTVGDSDRLGRCYGTGTPGCPVMPRLARTEPGTGGTGSNAVGVVRYSSPAGLTLPPAGPVRPALASAAECPSVG